jgi:sulfite oxidase
MFPRHTSYHPNHFQLHTRFGANIVYIVTKCQQVSLYTAIMDYSNDPQHSEQLIVQGIKPFNAEPVSAALVEFKYTPEDLFYCRNHSPVRIFEEDTYFVTVNEGLDKELRLSLSDLRTLFPKVEIVAAVQVRTTLPIQPVLTLVQCAGNRRNEMGAIMPVRGVAWKDGVVANTKWTGARLCDVLNYAGVTPERGGHVCFASHATLCEDDTYFGASIPLAKALSRDGDVLLAYEVRFLKRSTLQNLISQYLYR